MRFCISYGEGSTVNVANQRFYAVIFASFDHVV
ncbi:hypothetical protein B0G84_7609 [Paraburkholderia sp. BL8N3]|nr:hypothetical protein B0G84_7609 [Paraburkholderia sp. BL8N3]